MRLYICRPLVLPIDILDPVQSRDRMLGLRPQVPWSERGARGPRLGRLSYNCFLVEAEWIHHWADEEIT